MKKPQRLIATLLLFGMPTYLLAAQTYLYCTQKQPDYIYLGASMMKVVGACGEPIRTEEKYITPVKQQLVDQWIYHHQPNSAFAQGFLYVKQNAMVINFVDNQVSAIEVEGQAVKSTHYCNPELPIAIGDTMQKVYQICFWADIKHQITQTIPLPTEQQIVLTYEPSPNTPLKKLYFKNLKLIKIE